MIALNANIINEKSPEKEEDSIDEPKLLEIEIKCSSENNRS